MRAEPGVVHQHVDRSFAIGEAVFDLRELRGIGEIGDEHFGGDAMPRTELLREHLEPRFVARDEHDTEALRREL